MGSLWIYRYRPMRVRFTTSTTMSIILRSFRVSKDYAAAQRPSTEDVEKISPKGEKMQLYYYGRNLCSFSFGATYCCKAE